MKIAQPILDQYPDLSEAQRRAVGHLEGPLLVIAGPGSGKTYAIVLRALNLLLLERASPGEMVLCTFTQKAALEMRDRLAAAARKVGYAHILERRHGRRVDRLLLYWTSELQKEDALMVLPYDPRRVEQAGRHFDETVRRIQTGAFEVTEPPEARICRECDLRMLCQAEGLIRTAGAVA